MGKPRALKSRDIVPAVKIDLTAKSKKRVDFDNVEEFSDLKAGESKNNIQDEEESPEEVKADSYEILQLKEQLESTAKKDNRKRKRSKPTLDEEPAPADDLLDIAVLDSIERGDHEGSETKSSTGVRIEVIGDASEVKSNKKYIGNFEITVMEDHVNPVLRFQLSKDIADFSNKKSSSLERVRYTTFMSQKRPTAAKSFRKVG